uniref:7TM_GPCR_Srx domain-containing protein n=1 Tax=Steinernema glaseri TaxID=37863 RepID=A0A1I7Z8F8_9BILA
MNRSTAFVYGSELRGNGNASTTDVIVGITLFSVAFVAVILGVVNLYFLKKVKMFHNPFGWFWASRTVGEMLTEMVHLLYNGPVTILQLQSINVWQGITPYLVLFIGSVSACQMHTVIAVNRCIAIYSPLRYGQVFSKRVSYAVIAFSWIGCVFLAPWFFVFPCNLVGYDPQFYSYIFIKCYAGQERQFSYVGTAVNVFCFIICSSTVLVDISTLSRIIYVQKSAFQNVVMLMSVSTFVYQNYQNPPKGKIVDIVQILSIMTSHIANPLSLILFNPEVRGRIGRSIGTTVVSSTHGQQVASL